MLSSQRFTSKLCGMCTQSHGGKRCGLDLEVLKFQLIMTDVVAMVGHMAKWQVMSFWIVWKDLSRRVGGGIRLLTYSPWCHVKHVLVMKSGVNNLLIHDRNTPRDLTLTSLYERSVLFSCNRKMRFSSPPPCSGIFNTSRVSCPEIKMHRGQTQRGTSFSKVQRLYSVTHSQPVWLIMCWNKFGKVHIKIHFLENETEWKISWQIPDVLPEVYCKTREKEKNILGIFAH